MKEQIGDTAGKIWKVLQTKEQMTVSQLSKTVKERDTMVYQALGWLAREDKIAYTTKGNRTFVSLVR